MKLQQTFMDWKKYILSVSGAVVLENFQIIKTDARGPHFQPVESECLWIGLAHGFRRAGQVVLLSIQVVSYCLGTCDLCIFGK